MRQALPKHAWRRAAVSSEMHAMATVLVGEIEASEATYGARHAGREGERRAAAE